MLSILLIIFGIYSLFYHLSVYDYLINEYLKKYLKNRNSSMALEPYKEWYEEFTLFDMMYNWNNVPSKFKYSLINDSSDEDISILLKQTIPLFEKRNIIENKNEKKSFEDFKNELIKETKKRRKEKGEEQ